MSRTKVGVVGCGNISGIYLQADRVFDVLDIVACADLISERAKARAEEFGVPRACTTEELLADPDIEIVVNLTNPEAHAEVAFKAVAVGKSVHNEKPLTVEREDARRLLETAQARGLRVGCAPDTFLGAGLQTCRKLIDDGWIGTPIAATAFMLCHGYESWHPNPDYYYQPGAGPMFDMGPYYLTALTMLMGPVSRVSGSAQITFPERIITSQPLHGMTIKVNTPTHVAGTLEFASGAIGTIIMSFDVWAHRLPHIEIYGTDGTMSVPDPNGFGGPVRVRRPDAEDWIEVPLTHGYARNSRGIGVADLAYALRSGRPHRASGELGFHVLDIMHAFLDSAHQRQQIDLTSTCTRPAPLPMGLREGMLDD
jgi:predicted dehydrogenase